jgi:hypothetical protein
MPGELDGLYKYLEEDNTSDTSPAPTSVPDYVRKARKSAGLVKEEAKITPEQSELLKQDDFDKKDVTGTGVVSDLALGAAQGVSNVIGQVADLIHTEPKPNAQQIAAGDVGSGIPESELQAHSTAEAMATSVSQFLTGFVGYGKLLKVVGTGGKLFTVAKNFAQSALTSATVFDPLDDRLSNLIEAHPSLHNPITAYLAADPKDSKAEGRLKNALEDIALGAVTGPLLHVLSGRKVAQAILEKSGPEAAAKHLDGVAETLHAAPELPKEPRVYTKGLLSDEAKEKLIADVTAPKPDVVLSSKDFNYSKMDSPDGVKQVMDEMSSAIASKIDIAKGGTQTLKDIQEMASVLGEDADQLMGSLRQEAKGAPERAARFVAGKRLLQSMAREVSDLAKSVDAGSKEAGPKLDAMLNRMSLLQTDLKAIQTSSARTTSAGRIRTLDSFSPQEVRALIAADGDMAAVAGLVRQKTLAQKATAATAEYWINAILSNPITHTKNIISNAFQSVALPGRQLIGGLMSFNPTQAKEALSTYVGLVTNARDSWALAKKSFLLEDSILDAGGKIERADRATGNSWLGKTLRLSSRFLTAEDEFFKQLNYRANLKAKLTSDGIEKGLKGDELAAFVTKQFDDSFEKRFVKGEPVQGAALDTDSLNYAKAVTFTDDLNPNSWPAKVSRLANEHPAFKLVVPFIRTPWNILKSTARLTPPLEALRKGFWDDLRAGGAKRADAFGRLTMGGSLYTLGYFSAANGTLTGDGPKDPDTRRQLMATGWRPRSIKIGDTYVSYDGIEPASTIFSLMANYHEVSAYMKEKDREEFASTLVSAVAKSMVNKTYLRGIADLMGVLDDPDRNGEAYISRQAASFVPFSGLQKNIRDQVDPVRRSMNEWYDGIRNTIPGWSDSLPPQRNIFGEIVTGRQAIGPDAFSPFTSSKDLGDKVADELAQNSIREGGFSMPSRKFGNVEFTPQQYDKVLQTMGTLGNGGMKAELKKLIESEDYKELKDSRGVYKSAKREAIERILGVYEHQAKLKVIDSDKDLKAQVELDTKNKAAAKGNAPEQIQPLQQLSDLLNSTTNK